MVPAPLGGNYLWLVVSFPALIGLDIASYIIVNRCPYIFVYQFNGFMYSGTPVSRFMKRDRVYLAVKLIGNEPY
jgi:uncharacterized membrane protein